MKKNTRRKNLKGGDNYVLQDRFKETFNKLYNYISEKDKPLQNDLENEIFRLYQINPELINSSTNYKTIQDFYDSEKNLYTKNFMKFINTIQELFDDKNSIPEIIFLKIELSFPNDCYNPSFKNKIIKHMLNLYLVSIYNHKIILPKLKDTMFSMYKTIANCDAGIVEQNLPIFFRDFFSKYTPHRITEKITGVSPETISDTTTKIASTTKTLLQDFLSIPYDVYKYGVQEAFLPERTKELVSRKFQTMPELEKIDFVLKLADDEATVQASRTQFILAVDLYVENYVSSYDEKSTFNNYDIKDAISEFKIRESAKQAFNSELTLLRINAMQGHGQISNAVKSLGYALTPISLGISFIGAYFIEWLISKIF